MKPLPSSSNFLKASSKDKLEDLIICLSFSMMSASHWELDELTDTIGEDDDSSNSEDFNIDSQNNAPQ